MADVARVCGIARSTVSGILNERDDCYASKQTRAKVWAAVRQLGYRPSFAARGLVSGRTMTLGLINTGGDLESSARVCIAFERKARQHGYMTVVAFNPNEPLVEDAQLDALDDRGIDGICAMLSEEGDHASLRRIAKRGVPVVTLDAAGRVPQPEGAVVDDVSCDHYRGGQMQVQHLIAQGKRRLAIADMFQTCHVVEQRVAGMLDAAAAAGLPEPVRMQMPFQVHPVDRWGGDESRFIERFFTDTMPEVEGVMGTGDQPALAVAGVLLRMGKSIPGDVAVIGFDSQSYGAQPLLPLSSIALPNKELGEAACDLLVQRLTQPEDNASAKSIMLAPRLVQRASTIGPAQTQLRLEDIFNPAAP